MNKNIRIICLIAVLCCVSANISLAADEAGKKESFGQKTKSFIQRLFSYPANVAQGTVDVAADTGKHATEVVTTEIKTVGQVVTGDVDKTKEVITEPLTGTAETVVKAAEDTANIPIEAAKE